MDVAAGDRDVVGGNIETRALDEFTGPVRPAAQRKPATHCHECGSIAWRRPERGAGFFKFYAGFAGAARALWPAPAPGHELPWAALGRTGAALAGVMGTLAAAALAWALSRGLGVAPGPGPPP